MFRETSSRKSTQLVQFLSDSRIAIKKFIIYTRPCKIATILIVDRINEEVTGVMKIVQNVL